MTIDRMFAPAFDGKSPSDAHSSLEYVINHVFSPVYHPTKDDYTKSNAHALVCVVRTAARAYDEHVDHVYRSDWIRVIKMLENLQAVINPTSEASHSMLISQLGGMEAGDTLIFHTPYHLAICGVIFQKQNHSTLCKALDVILDPAQRKSELLHSALAIRDAVFGDENFRSKVAHSLCGTSKEPLTDDDPEFQCIIKHFGSICNRDTRDHKDNWSRSDLWFLIRVAIQSSLQHSPLGQATYKAFMLFLMHSLANHAVNYKLSSFLIYSMSTKILRRFRKLASSISDCHRDAALQTCASLSRTLDQRWQELQASQRSSLHWDPAQLDLIGDINLSVSCIRAASTSPANYRSDPQRNPFTPQHRPRCTLDDIMSSWTFYPTDRVTLCDVERAIAEGIDDWVARVTDIDDACKLLENLVEHYLRYALQIYHSESAWNNLYGGDYTPGSSPTDSDDLSIMFLTIIELWIALDKLVIKEIPLLSDYPPEVTVNFLGSLLLRDAVNNYRLSRAYQYVFVRHAQAHPRWLALSNEFTEQFFPCRYYDNSPHLQHLKSCIEAELPAEPLYAKVVVFELQCPPSFSAWRAVSCRISNPSNSRWGERIGGGMPVCDIPALQTHARVRQSPLVAFSSPSSPKRWDGIYYLHERSALSYFKDAYDLPQGPYAESGTQRYLGSTIHTSNEVLADQVDCHPDLSLQEFVSFGHLRSGGSLQWLNILQELRSRTLNFRHQEVYLLFAQATAEVGPTDSTGVSSWHQEPQDTSFCCTLLDELEDLFIDIGVGSLDGPAMAIISLLASILASRSSKDISERAICLLGNVRQKTFKWVQELLYDVRNSPTNQESLSLLRDMAAVCRSTFDVGSIANELVYSVMDIEIALSCMMLIPLVSLPSSGLSTYSRLLLNRDDHLCVVLEGALRDAIIADASNIGVDRAVQMVWPGYRPSPRRWNPLEPPNSRWLVCETASTRDRRSQTVHVNLLDGSLLVDGSQIGNTLPSQFTLDEGYEELFGCGNLMVVTSDLPGMEFMTMSAIEKHYVHFGVRRYRRAVGPWTRKPRLYNKVVILAQRKDMDDIFELIPRKDLRVRGALPASLIEDHVHWLNLSTSIIEIRPAKAPWTQSSDNWTIDHQLGHSRVTKGTEFLVNRQSLTWAMVSSCFRCLDTSDNFIITVIPVETTQSPSLSPSLQLSITLPRYGLTFFINELGNLQSRDFENMVYDEDQCIGTLFGLTNRLILRPKFQVEADVIPRCIIIPYGLLEQRGHGVSVDLSSPGPVSYYTYQVDSELGCLKGVASLESRLYLAHLHALTSSSCRPDPLTGRTGIEEAISLIWLAGTRWSARGLGAWCCESPSPQIRFAFTKIETKDAAYDQWKLPSKHALSQEAYLFQSEVTLRKEPSVLLDQLLFQRPPPNVRRRAEFPPYNHRHRGPSSPNIDPLRQLFSSLRTNQTAPAFQSQYISRLHSSVAHLKIVDPIGINHQYPGRASKPSVEALRQCYVECRNNYEDTLNMIKTVLAPKTHFERILDQCGQWPRVTPFVLFRCLASTSPFKTLENWKKCLTSLALLALDTQRARRLLRLTLDNVEEEVYTELENEGCDGWEAAEHPDWLLIQLQGNFLIRRAQAHVAKEMMSPRAGNNTVMQVNMGEGKTSVIIPICAAALADGNQLVRVVVPKALVPQTIQVLTDRLCGLVNKPVYYLSFSRGDVDALVEYRYMVELLNESLIKCRNECCIVVMQPEHLLSLKLACVEMQLPRHGFVQSTVPVVQAQSEDVKPEDEIESSEATTTQIVPKRGFKGGLKMLTGWLTKTPNKTVRVSAVLGKVKRPHRKVDSPGVEESIETESVRIVVEPESDVGFKQARHLSEIQRFFETHARDILDESDDVLRPQFQMIYAIGDPYPFEGSPDRWVIVQQVLGLVKRHAYLLSTPGSHVIRVDGGLSGSFPHIHILQANAGDQLMSFIADDVLDGGLSALSFHCAPGLRGTLREFILRKEIHSDTVKTVESYAHQSASWGSLLLLRGLLAHDILLFALTQRRWRVDYGLDLACHPRTLVAIPYLAKDVPTERAEFGHPEITILLTCLSYYYGGLSGEQLRSSFEFLLQLDDPSYEYALWLEDCSPASLPGPLWNLRGVNIRSSEQWTKYLFPLFAQNKRAIDLYLSNIVFTRHAKEYPRRILGSNWDIAERKNHLVTGFSGTNDAQYLLPTSISQDDPDHLQQTGTNARILAHLLGPENSSYVVTSDKNGERWTTLKLLETIVAQDPQIRVLLDVGAQMLDLSNPQLAKAWLDCTSDVETAGAIYFSEDDRLMVLTRNGTTQPLSLSPLVQQLHRCVAYLDDAHTRGTDIKFPRGFRAAVTLGHKVTKDRLVQGCMRMRKLGDGHSVMFFAPHEVDQRIRGLVSKENQDTPVTVADVLCWAIHVTWDDIQRLAPNWAQQGLNHQARYEAWTRFRRGEATPNELPETWAQSELKSLANMYMACNSPPPSTALSMKLPPQIRARCENLGVLSLRDVRLDEEQEREVSREIERERELERPPRGSPVTHSTHPAVVAFVKTGVIPSPIFNEAFRRVFVDRIEDAACSEGHACQWSPHVLATMDFCKTIQESGLVEENTVDYMRPVQWVLSGNMDGKETLVLLSPHETHSLMPEIRISEHVHLHLYIPRTTRRMKPSDDLKLYAVPPLPLGWTPPWTLIDQLNVFAGQLYLTDYKSYVRLCRFLCIPTDDPQGDAGTTLVARNWFSDHDPTDAEMKDRFEGTSLPFVMQLLTARRGFGFAETHMGRILEWWSLNEDDFCDH